MYACLFAFELASSLSLWFRPPFLCRGDVKKRVFVWKWLRSVEWLRLYRAIEFRLYSWRWALTIASVASGSYMLLVSYFCYRVVIIHLCLVLSPIRSLTLTPSSPKFRLVVFSCVCLCGCYLLFLNKFVLFYSILVPLESAPAFAILVHCLPLHACLQSASLSLVRVQFCSFFSIDWVNITVTWGKCGTYCVNLKILLQVKALILKTFARVNKWWDSSRNRGVPVLMMTTNGPVARVLLGLPLIAHCSWTTPKHLGNKF